MPRIAAAARALPQHVVSQQQIKIMMKQVFAGRVDDLERKLKVFDNARIEHRQLVMPPEWYLEKHPSGERTQVYQQEGLRLALQAAEKCLQEAGLAPDDIDHVIFVSTTGLATPSLDALLINRLGMAASVSRLPVWGLGCAGGAAGLSRAFDYCLAHPDKRVLLVALECCSLAFRDDDPTLKNLVGTALFADGAAAVVLGGNDAVTSGPRLLATASHLFPGTERIMGWDFDDAGMQLVLSPQLPQLVRQELRGLIEGFLLRNERRMDELVHFIAHPGGARVIDAYLEALALPPEALALSAEMLRRHGNVSSVSVLLVLEDWLATEPGKRPGPGLVSAFGPGFSAELLLLEV